ncbi:MAG: hypothetical protein GXP49_02610, partial [Deltaproteobacteria bacterium]|nr:hypothetical protein [Deltaproteobacteria bacterium]
MKRLPIIVVFLLPAFLYVFQGCSGTNSNDSGGPDCLGIDCSGHGTCLLMTGVAYCDCDPGYNVSATGLECFKSGGDSDVDT